MITFGVRAPLECKAEWSLHHLAFALSLSNLDELGGLDLICAALNHKL